MVVSQRRKPPASYLLALFLLYAFLGKIDRSHTFANRVGVDGALKEKQNAINGKCFLDNRFSNIVPTNGAGLSIAPGLYLKGISVQGPSSLAAPSSTTSGRPPTPVIDRNNP